MNKHKSIRDMYIAYSNKKLNNNYKNIRTILKVMKENNDLTNVEYTFIVSKFFEMAANKIIEGKSLYLPRLGYIYIKKINKTTNKKIDWGKSNKYKQELIDNNQPLYNHETGEGYKWLQFLEADFYLKWYLKRDSNKRLLKYVFKPTHNNFDTKNKDVEKRKPVLGTKGKLSKANKDNPYLHLVYVGKLNNIK